ncbi:hypothetical protein GL325_13930 [Aeromicrobium sp. 636]|uniref:Uncharacterized protein n=1 Tax=Aeromicrobium senzhongii TaxID=2663859 RepID=A0A8I0K1V8_9ACTN|nr:MULTISPECIES: hypothetical protein [Aeromicrobium]MBC9227423.1 hypothetical protein [Aeromicrobium senzhongii]MCQ3999520.1 hypothetical protein [Aeromicrobium sp. 636]
MRISWLAPVVLGAVLLAGCADRGDDPDRPATTPSPSRAAAEATLRDYLVAADAGDCDAVKQTVLLPEQVECGDVHEQEGRWSAGGADLRAVAMTTEVVETSATVTVDWPKDPEDVWSLEHVDGSWRVVNADAGDGV